MDSEELWLLKRDRSILVEALREQTALSKSRREAFLDPRPYMFEGQRLSQRLLAVQKKIEDLGDAT